MRIYKGPCGEDLPKGIKYCPDCKNNYPLDSFYSYIKYGDKLYYMRRCKPCHVTNNKKTDERTGASKRHYRENREEYLKRSQAYVKTKKGLESKKRAYAKYWYNPDNQIKNQARALVNHSLRDGKIVKPFVCENCKEEKPLEAHHHDYEKALDVAWLCKTCHWDWHSKYKTVQELQEGNKNT